MGRDRGERRAHHYGPPGYLDYVHDQPCAIRGCKRRPTQAAHATTRGAGGTWEDLLPLCWKHHAEQHTAGILTFQKRYQINLARVAAAVRLNWEKVIEWYSAEL